MAFCRSDRVQIPGQTKVFLGSGCHSILAGRQAFYSNSVRDMEQTVKFSSPISYSKLNY